MTLSDGSEEGFLDEYQNGRSCASLPAKRPHRKARDSSISTDTKMALAKRTSAMQMVASVPGAYQDDENQSNSGKVSEGQLVEIGRLRALQKRRGIDEALPDLPTDGETLVELQSRMTNFQRSTNMEDLKAQEQLMSKVRLCRRCVIIFVLILLIASITFVVLLSHHDSTVTGADMSSPLLSVIGACFRGDGVYSDRYSLLRTQIIKTYPSLEENIDTDQTTARAALCWLAYDDLFYVPAEGENDELTQRFIMALLYYHFVGTDVAHLDFANNNLARSNWLSADREVCQWNYIDCTSNLIYGLNLRILSLKGQIPTEISLLRNLTSLSLSQNFLSGSIPSELYTLSNLETLELGTNQLNGTLSDDINKLTNLMSLKIETNVMSGSLPGMRSLSNLVSLQISQNPGIIGAFPDVSQSSKLEDFVINDAHLTGLIPSFVWNLTALKTFTVRDCGLTGTIPSEFALLSNLKVLQLSLNDMSGTLPSELGLISGLDQLLLDNIPGVSGTVPTELGKLTQLEIMRIQGSLNYAGEMPDQICALVTSGKLQELSAACEVIPCQCCDCYN